MSESIQRHSHISITRSTAEGVVHTDVRITTSFDVGKGVCFDPDSCCDEREKAMINVLRAYLRPQEAPECLLTRLRATLDRCCGEYCEDNDDDDVIGAIADCDSKNSENIEDGNESSVSAR